MNSVPLPSWSRQPLLPWQCGQFRRGCYFLPEASLTRAAKVGKAISSKTSIRLYPPQMTV